MKTFAFVIAVALVSATAVSPALAQAAAATGTLPARISTTDTDLGTMLENPAAKAVLLKHIPALIANDQIDMARSMTLRQLQSYVSDQLTDDTLAKIDSDLAKLPAK